MCFAQTAALKEGRTEDGSASDVSVVFRAKNDEKSATGAPVGPEMLGMPPKKAQHAPKIAKDWPKLPQDSPKLGQDGAKLAQDAPKMPPR